MKNVIYKIVNLVNDKFYVGSSADAKIRFRQHRKLLRQNRHHCKHLQAAWNKYGEDKFDFRIIERLESASLLEAAEDVWLSAWVGKPECYNSGYSAKAPWRGAPKECTPNFGKVMSTEAKANISGTLKAFYAADYNNHPRVGTTHSEETRAKISANRVGKSAGSLHYRFGKEVSPEVRQRIGDTQRGVSKAPYIMSPQGRAHIAAAVKRGADSHFYGKRPSNADDMQRSIHVIKRDRTEEVYPSLTYMRDNLGISLMTIIRACKSGKPIMFGPFNGWVMSYNDEKPAQAPEVPDQYKDMPRTRQEAKELGAKFYFTGIPCDRGHISERRTKGTCLACAREDYKKENAKRRGKV